MINKNKLNMTMSTSTSTTTSTSTSTFAPAPIVIYTIPSFSCWSELLPPAHSCSYDAGLGAVRSLTLGGFALGHMVIVDLRPACPLPALRPLQLPLSSSTRSRASRAGPNYFRLRTRAAMTLGSVLCAA